MNSEKLQINLELLPRVLQPELINYYHYLLAKHEKEKEKKYKMKDFFSTVNENKFDLPEGYKFDRELANER
jgi:hypothetical protein